MLDNCYRPYQISLTDFNSGEPATCASAGWLPVLGKKIDDPPPQEIVKLGISRTFQQVKLVPDLLLVEQSAQAALKIAERAHVMELGEFILEGTAIDIAADERVTASYLGFQHDGASVI